MEDNDEIQITQNIKKLELEKAAISIVKTVRETAKDILNDPDNLIVSLPALIFQIMKLVDLNKSMSGNDKKNLVILVVNNVLKNEFDKNESLKMIVDMTLSSIIELAISVSKDGKFNKRIKKCFSCK